MALLLALALNLAQVGAMAHAYSHATTPRGPDRIAVHASLCGECMVFGVVLLPGVAASAGCAPALPASFSLASEDGGTLAALGPRHHFEAQGPPAS
ncbi:MAG: hypothetical protein JSS24_07600 [Proteobacteria bacterium]|nr:hypothetical protein [Pseudomonadota bacterium]